MVRRKRMEFQRPGKHRRAMPESFDRLFITRRMLVAKGAVAGGFALLASRLGYLQIKEHSTAVHAAANNTQSAETLPAPRGLIYDAKGRLLAKNETAFEVRVTPASLPSAKTAATERRRILDTLIADLQLPDVLVVDPSEIPAAQRDDVYRSIAVLQGTQDADLDDAVKHIQTEADHNYVVLLDTNLTIDEAAKWREQARTVPGLNVMNRIDYQLANTVSGSMNPISVQSDVNRQVAMQIEANQLSLPGVSVDSSVLVRKYPAGPCMSHLLGFVGPVSAEDMDKPENQDANGKSIYEQNDLIGKDGLEAALEPILRGAKGHRLMLRDAMGNEIGIVPGSEAINSQPRSGDSVTLTLDLELQALATRALKDYIDFSNRDRQAKHNTDHKEWAKSGAVVAIDPRTGDVLAAVSYPQYDNQLLVQGISQAQFNALIDPKAGKPYFNRALASAQPPGSTFKIFLASAALHEKTIDENTVFKCTGGIGLPIGNSLVNAQIHPCWQWHGHEGLTLNQAIRASCDVFFYQTGTKNVKDLSYEEISFSEDGKTVHYGGDLYEFSGLGIDLIHDNMTKEFWFGQYVNFLLPGEMQGLVPSQEWLAETTGGEGWTAGETMHVSIGQGAMQVTPLQLALNTAAIANRGTIHTPRLHAGIIKGDEVVAGNGTPAASITADPTHPTPVAPLPPLRKLSYDPATFDAVRQGMFDVVNTFEGSDSKVNGSASSIELADGTFSTDLAWPRTNPPGTSDKDRIAVAGKTGTAEVARDDAADPAHPNPDDSIDPKTGKYYNQHAWFTCFAPFDKPEIALTVLIEYGGEGSTYAAPCADVILRGYFEMTGKRKRGEKNDKGRMVSVLSPDGEPILDFDKQESLVWFKPEETFDTSGNID